MRLPAVALLIGLATALHAVAAPPALPTIAVLYFEYDGSDMPLSDARKGLTAMLVSELSGDPGYLVVERERFQSLLTEQKLQRSARFDATTTARIGLLLGARFLVLGSYLVLSGTLRVDARIVEVETGRIVRTAGASGTASDMMPLVQTIAEALRKGLSESLPPTVPRSTPRVSRPKKLALLTAARYGRALEAADIGDSVTAAAELRTVLDEQPDFALAKATLERLVK